MTDLTLEQEPKSIDLLETNLTRHLLEYRPEQLNHNLDQDLVTLSAITRNYIDLTPIISQIKREKTA